MKGQIFVLARWRGGSCAFTPYDCRATTRSNGLKQGVDSVVCQGRKCSTSVLSASGTQGRRSSDVVSAQVTMSIWNLRLQVTAHGRV